jgi:peptidoglycan L-alanyl-D-glutamate endopeptidase CwlK
MNSRSIAALKGVHPDLVAVTKRALELIRADAIGLDFIVTEGLRTQERQAQLVKVGASRTMNSLHLLGRAVDLAAVVQGQGVRWDWPLYKTLSKYMKQASLELGVSIEWGGDWATFKDGPHFQLSTTVRQA